MIIDCELEEGETNAWAFIRNIRRDLVNMTDEAIVAELVTKYKLSTIEAWCEVRGYY